ncbi:hypothetical protein VTN77DRAFT_4800 [Rasamsonia byssochlamydoides]|uniref:uncharacterized protein n=1 Tax=Rasamsonia byssochlamydoides TaxID=89139 RepID=UPI003744227F
MDSSTANINLPISLRCVRFGDLAGDAFRVIISEISEYPELFVDFRKLFEPVFADTRCLTFYRVDIKDAHDDAIDEVLKQIYDQSEAQSLPVVRTRQDVNALLMDAKEFFINLVVQFPGSERAIQSSQSPVGESGHRQTKVQEVEAPNSLDRGGPQPTISVEEKPASWICVSGPLDIYGRALKYPPTQCEPFNDVFNAVCDRKPAVIHGPYRSGKTTLLRALGETLGKQGIRTVFLTMRRVVEPDKTDAEDEVDRFYEYFSKKIFGTHPCRRRISRAGWKSIMAQAQRIIVANDQDAYAS